MKNWKASLSRLMRPRPVWTALLTPLCAAALCVVFYRGMDESPLACPVYVLSAYTLAVWAVRVPGVVRRIKAALYRHRLGRRYMTDISFRGSLSLHASTAVNGFYALFKLGAGIAYHSLWFGALAIYYLILTAARGLLLHSTYRRDSGLAQEYRASRLCGCLLFALNLPLSAVTVQMVLHGKGYTYPGFFIYVMALYAFYSVTLSVINLFKYRRLGSPVLSAAKVLGLVTAMVSMLSLQTAMFSSFGSAGDDEFQRLMNALTGGAVCLLIFIMAVCMIARAAGELKKLKPQDLKHTD